jgi:hypothetical protein
MHVAVGFNPRFADEHVCRRVATVERSSCPTFQASLRDAQPYGVVVVRGLKPAATITASLREAGAKRTGVQRSIRSAHRPKARPRSRVGSPRTWERRHPCRRFGSLFAVLIFNPLAGRMPGLPMRKICVGAKIILDSSPARCSRHQRSAAVSKGPAAARRAWGVAG